MSRTVLQVPIDTILREKAEKVAERAGFSSVQEVVRVFLTKLASQKVVVGFHEQTLSKMAEDRYIQMIEDIKKGKNVAKTDSASDLIAILK